MIGAAFTRSLDLLLTLLEENDSATIVANPRVVAMDGKTADIQVVTEQVLRDTHRGRLRPDRS